jgi:hypothetical protein
MKKAELLAENAKLKETLEGVSKSMYENGLHLTEQPFIPEYLGFLHTSVESATGAIKANVYSKHGFNIARHIDSENPYWVVLKPTGDKVEVLINTMYEAFFVLNALGCILSMKVYIRDGKL